MPFVETEQLGNYVEPELAAAMYTPEQYKLEQEEAQKKDVDFGTLLIAGFERDNIIASYQAKNNNRPSAPTDGERKAFASGEFNVFDVIPEEHKNNPDYVKEYAEYGSNQRMVDWVSDNINRQEKNTQMLSDNLVAGMGASFLATVASPEQWPAFAVPAGLVLTKGSTAARLTLSQAVAYEAGIAGVSALTGEALLHETQPTRTKEESMYAVGGSVLFSSLLVSGIGLAQGRAFKTLKRLDDDMAKVDSNPAVGSVGAREADIPLPKELEDAAIRNVDGRIADGEIDAASRDIALQAERKMLAETLSEVKHPKIMRVLGYAHPSVRIATSKMNSARVLGEQLVSDSLTRGRHIYGDTLGPALETTIDQFKYEVSQKIQDIMQGQYNRYVQEASKTGGKKLDYDEFSSLVGKANRAEDASDIAEVSAAAKQLRSEISKPLETRLVEQDMIDSYYSGFENLKREDLTDLVPEENLEKFFDGDIPVDSINKALPKEVMDELNRMGKLAKEAKIPKGDASYFHRQWDFGKMEADPQDFIKTIREALHDVSVDGMRNKETILENRIAKLREKAAAKAPSPDAEPVKPRSQGQRNLDKINKEKALGEASDELKNSRLNLDTKLRKTDTPEADVTKARDRVFDAQKRLIEVQRSKKIPIEQKILELEDELAIKRAEHTRYIDKQLDGDLTRAAQEIKNAIEGGTLSPSYRIKSFEAGPLKDRTFTPPSSAVDKYLINNAESVWNDYIENVSPSLHMKERFDSIDMKDELLDIGRDYDAAINAATSKKQAKALTKEKNQAISDLEAMRDSIHNRFKVPDGPNGFLSQGARRLREFNFMTLLGQMTVSAIPDVGHIIMRHGLRSFTGGLLKVAGMSQGLKLSMRQQRTFGMAADLVSNSRAERLAFLDNAHGLTTRADRAMQKMTTKFSRYTGMQHWNAGWKQFTGFIYSNDIINDAVKISKGTLDSKKITRYARGGLSKSDMQNIAKAMDAQKTSKMDGVWIPNPDEWADTALAQRFKNTLMKEVETTIVTPTVGDLPLVSRGELGRLVFQFKSFAMTANNKIILASLDDMSAQKMIGMLSMVALGGVSQMTRDATKGKKTDLSSEKGIKTFIDNSLDRSGLLAYWGDVNGMIEKATRGRVGIIPKLGAEPLDRYASRNVLGSILGPSAGRVSDITTITGAISAGDWRESDARAMRRMMLFNNLFWSHRAFNKIEESIGGKRYGPLGEEK
jgi:BMFP domain-containing protein YqiC